MDIVPAYARFLRASQKMHAVWPPVASRIDIGDYGVFHDGAFVRLGNVAADFGFETEAHDAGELELRASSDGVTVRRLQAGVPVSAFGSVDVDARLAIEFENEASFFLRAKALAARQMTYPAVVAGMLSDHRDWRRKWRIVSKVYAGRSVTFLAAARKGTAFRVDGKASVLATLEADWEFSGSLSVQSSNDLSVEIRGKRGPVGVEVFKVGFFGAAVPKSIGNSDGLLLPEADWDKEPEEGFL